MIREMTMDEALEVVGGEPQWLDDGADAGGGAMSWNFPSYPAVRDLNYDPAPTTRTTVHSPGSTTPVPSSLSPCRVGLDPTPYGGCVGTADSPFVNPYPTAPIRPFGR